MSVVGAPPHPFRLRGKVLLVGIADADQPRRSLLFKKPILAEHASSHRLAPAGCSRSAVAQTDDAMADTACPIAEGNAPSWASSWRVPHESRVYSKCGGETTKEPVVSSAFLTRCVGEPISLAASEISSARRKIELRYTPRGATIFARQRAQKPIPAPAIRWLVTSRTR